MIGPRRASLTGRATELAVLARAAESARRGSGGLVLVSGEAGVGKSRLCREFSASVDGALQLRGQAYAGDRVVANAILVDTLRSARRQAGSPLWPAARRRAATLGAIVPELLEESRGGAAIDDEAHAFETVLDAVAEAAGDRPVVWLAEDVQWADPASWRFLQYCARRAPSMRLLMLCTYRDDEAMPDDPAWTRFSVLGPREGTVRIGLGRLGRADAERVSRQLCAADVADEVVRSIAERSGGTPLLVEELAAMSGAVEGGAAGVPEVIRATARERSRMAGDAAQGLLQLAAVMGHDADLDLLVDLRPDQAQTIEPLVAAGLLRPPADAAGAAGVEFRHPLLREAVYEDIPWQRRRTLHAEAAEALTAHASTQSVERVAQHWELAGHPERGLDALVAVIGRARTRDNRQRCIALGQAALQLIDRYRRLGDRRTAVLDDLVEDMVAMGRWHEALSLVRPAWESAAPGSLRRTRLTALRAQAEWFGALAPWLGDMLAAELAAVGDSGSREAALLYTVAALIAYAHGRPQEADELAERARRGAIACGDLDLEARAVVNASFSRMRLTRQRTALVRDLHDLADRLAGAGLYARQTSVLLQVAHVTLGDADLARVEELGSTWNPWCAMGARITRAAIFAFAARYDEATAIADEVQARLGDTGQAGWYVAQVYTLAALMRGASREAEVRLAHMEACHTPDAIAERADDDTARGWLMWERGDLEPAVAAFEAALAAMAVTRLGPGGACGPYFVPLLIDALLRLGHAERAAAALDEATAAEAHPDMDRLTAAALACGALRLRPSPDTLSAALAACATADWPWLAGLARFWAGELLGDRGSASAARETWQRTGYLPGAERASLLLAHLDRRRGAERILTAREETVAALIAEGLSNAQIADRLGISPVTVAHHVSSVLDKLGVSSRTQVAVLLLAPGTADQP